MSTPYQTAFLEYIQVVCSIQNGKISKEKKFNPLLNTKYIFIKSTEGLI